MPTQKLTAAILGASGYVGGELARILLGHSGFELRFATSESSAGKPISRTHPNLRGATPLKFVSLSEVEKVDVVFACLPHGKFVHHLREIEQLADKVVDCSADFRLSSSAAYEKWYGWPHPDPAELAKWTCGIPELHREALKNATKIAVAGCTATASILALKPLVDAGVIDLTKIVFDIKTGSSGSGNKPSIGSHHPERDGVVRSYKLAGHRHTAEAIQQLGLPGVPSYAVTSVPTVRGIVCHAHAFLTSPLDDKALWKLYRGAYGGEPFVRIVKDPDGPHQLPEPKILSGTNFCDIGWWLDSEAGRITAISAIDNLGKGAAGQAVQAANVACGFDERTGLEFLGLHPC